MLFDDSQAMPNQLMASLLRVVCKLAQPVCVSFLVSCFLFHQSCWRITSAIHNFVRKLKPWPTSISICSWLAILVDTGIPWYSQSKNRGWYHYHESTAKKKRMPNKKDWTYIYIYISYYFIHCDTPGGHDTFNDQNCIEVPYTQSHPTESLVHPRMSLKKFTAYPE